MEIKGKIIAVLPIKSGTSKNGKEWKSQEYVIETSDDKYPKKCCFEVFGENIEKFNVQGGLDYIVQIDIDANQWKDKWFNKIRAWKVEEVSAQHTEHAQPTAQQGSGNNGEPYKKGDAYYQKAPAKEETDQLPF
jgi:hypothetical protein